MAEQRAHPRYAIELEAQLLLEGGREVRGRTQDISRGGFCILAPMATDPIAVGTHCGTLLALVFSETEFSEQLRLQATVCWYTTLKGRGVQIGVKFEPLDAQAKNYLELFIRFLEDGRKAAAAEEGDDFDDDEGSNPGPP